MWKTMLSKFLFHLQSFILSQCAGKWYNAPKLQICRIKFNLRCPCSRVRRTISFILMIIAQLKTSNKNFESANFTDMLKKLWIFHFKSKRSSNLSYEKKLEVFFNNFFEKAVGNFSCLRKLETSFLQWAGLLYVRVRGPISVLWGVWCKAVCV